MVQSGQRPSQSELLSNTWRTGREDSVIVCGHVWLLPDTGRTPLDGPAHNGNLVTVGSSTDRGERRTQR